MGKFIDLTGQHFGEWEVIEYTGNRLWKCKCSCGTLRDVPGADLRHNKSKSCGHSVNKFDDLTGRNFGYWKVIGYSGDRHWECECVCGKKKRVSGLNLKNGTTKSCGCIKDTFIDMTGQQFGELKVLKWLGDGFWRCKCSCGKELDVYGSNIRRNPGGTRSCGCKFYVNGSATRIENGVTQYRDAEQISRASSRESLIRYINTLGSKPTIKTLAKDLGLSINGTLGKVHKYGVELFVDLNSSVSGMEDELADFISTTTSEELIRNNRTILNGLELDMYIESKRIAVEFNGDYWHSELYKDKMYHQEKTLKSFKNGIRLIHIYEHEWLNTVKKGKLENLLKMVTGECETKSIYARNTEIVEIDNSEAVKFYNLYHLQNGVNSRVNMAMKYNSEVIAVMSFSVSRFSSNYQWELSRLCFKSSLRVIGGAQRMFKHFIKRYKPSSIISYCDISKFTGKVYTDLGFKFMGVSEPNYLWLNKNGDVKTRYQTQKSKLEKLGYSHDRDSTEASIMHELGYFRLYDSGNARFVWSIE